MVLHHEETDGVDHDQRDGSQEVDVARVVEVPQSIGGVAIQCHHCRGERGERRVRERRVRREGERSEREVSEKRRVRGE